MRRKQEEIIHILVPQVVLFLNWYAFHSYGGNFAPWLREQWVPFSSTIKNSKWFIKPRAGVSLGLVESDSRLEKMQQLSSIFYRTLAGTFFFFLPCCLFKNVAKMLLLCLLILDPGILCGSDWSGQLDSPLSSSSFSFGRHLFLHYAIKKGFLNRRKKKNSFHFTLFGSRIDHGYVCFLIHWWY